MQSITPSLGGSSGELATLSSSRGWAKTSRGRGIYTVKFNKNGHWLYVHVDDRIPCNRSGDPYFSCSSDPQESWVMVLEKAYAKLHGCYESLRGGHVEYSLQDCTGLASLRLRLTDPRFASEVESGAMWQKVKEYQNDGQLMGFSRSKATDPRAHEGGLLGGHVYPVVEVCELHADATADLEALDVQLVRIVDRWGIEGGGWKGDWSTGSALWDDYPDIKKIVDKKGDVRGGFWISWKDLVKNLNQIFVGYAIKEPETTASYTGSWISGDVKTGAGGNPLHESFPQNPQYCFACNEPTKVVVTVNQTDSMLSAGLLNNSGYSHAVGYCVIKITGTKGRTTKFHPAKMAGLSATFARARSTSGVCDLMPGRYAIVPCTVEPDVELDFTLQVQSDKAIILENNGDKMADGDDEESDDEELGEVTPVVGVLDQNLEDSVEDDDETRGLQSMMLMVGDLATYVREVGREVKGLEENARELEARLEQAL